MNNEWITLSWDKRMRRWQLILSYIAIYSVLNSPFFRPVVAGQNQQDITPPEAVPLSPPNGASAVSLRDHIIVQLTDDTGVEISSLKFTVGDQPAIDVNDPRLTYNQGILTYAPAENAVLGIYGEVVVIGLTISDVLGNELQDFHWSFQIELETHLNENVLLVDAPQGAVPTVNDGSHLSYVAHGGDVYTFAYTGSSSGVMPGKILVSLDERNAYKLLVVESTDDPDLRQVTVQTKTIALAALLDQGSLKLEGVLHHASAQPGSDGTMAHTKSVPDYAAHSLTGPLGDLDITLGPLAYGDQAPMIFPLDNVKLYEQGGVAITITRGHVSVLPRFWISGNFHEGQWSQLRSELTVAIDVNMSVDATAEYEWPCNNEKTLWKSEKRMVMGYIPFFGLVIPVWVDVNFELNGGVEGIFRAMGTISTDIRATQRVGVSTELRDGDWHNTPHQTGTITATEPTGYAEASMCLKAYLEPSLSLCLESLVGPKLSVTPYLKLGGFAEFTGQDWDGALNLIGGIDGELTFKYPAWNGEGELGPWTLFDYQVVLAGLTPSFSEDPPDETDRTTIHLNVPNGHDAYVLRFGNGIEHEVDLYFLVALQIAPDQLVVENNTITANSADIDGFIKVWGTATEIGLFDERSTLNVSCVKNLDLSGVSCNTTLGRTLSDLMTIEGELLDRTFYSSEQVIPYRFLYEHADERLTLWVRLPSPFIYSDDNEWYRMSATADISTTSGRLQGYVTDRTSGEAIVGALVQLTSWEKTVTTRTDGCGWFAIDKVPPGPLQIVISSDGYETFSDTRIMPAVGRMHMEFTLEAADEHDSDSRAIWRGPL